ncbi:hypothetical protein RHSIM_Rhsim12G0194900 [Rhododendron simsii]|uniref:ADP,ATP carrier protein n=1 Tax=Rhododendron simsii TaxID=118357 RepID=A0A834G108_RHOSS|nr:hypothetical protein RHSIM_Rhsim12G0194900 [Rhododendron simsii]
MEAVLQTKGVLSLPSKPNPRAFNLLPSQGLRHRFITPLKAKPLDGLSLSLNGLSRFHGFATNPHGVFQKNRTFHICRAEAAAAADGQPLFGEPESPKFMGVEIVTLKKIIPLGLMFFCILFNYTILRDTKDVLVVTAKGSSAEIIPFLKTWVNLPMAIGFMLLYTKLANVLSKQALFYTVILPFIAFFGAFGFVLYPLSHYFHPTAFTDNLLATLGPRFLGPLAIIRIWSFCLFYVMAELWGSVVVSVLFWGFANQDGKKSTLALIASFDCFHLTEADNDDKFVASMLLASMFVNGIDITMFPISNVLAGTANNSSMLLLQITTVEEAKKFYPLFGLGANVALIFSGRTVKYFSSLRQSLGPGVDGWAMSLKAMMSIVVGMGFTICFLYWWVNKYVPLPTRSKKKKEKPNMGTMESLKFLVSSRYIRDLATLVVAYGISINLVEVTWKSKLKAQFPSPNEYSSFMGDFSTATGVTTFTMMLLSQWIFNKYGWGVAAKITPTVLLLTGVGFFSLILFGGPVAPVIAKFGMTPLLAAVYVGALQNIFSKSAKYSLFDPCKEMAYIPLDEETKVKGKAAIDVVCNPLGKSGGALIQQFMILTFGSLANSTPYLGGILLVIVLAWLAAAKSLDTQFTALRQEEELEKEMERAAVKIPVLAEEKEGGNGSFVGGPALNPTGGDSTSGSSTSSPRNL